jgi:flagellar hook protein FlgE
MGIFGALNTAVNGMRAQAFALENISGNIANSQTIAYKREDTSFIDLIADAAPSKQFGGNVIANSRATNTLQGDIQSAATGTFMAINGGGYFVVEKPSGFSGNLPTFSGNDLYSRRGDFTTDQNGYLVNGAGYFLKGIPIDPTTGNLAGSVPELLQFSNAFLPPEPTATIQYQANLPAYPLTPNHNTAIADSELLVPSATKYTTSDPRIPPGGTGIVIGSDVTQFLGDSISGGAITAYDAAGNAVNINLRWAKIDTALTGGTDTWNLFYETDSAPALGTDPAWINAGTDYTFGANGQISPAVPTITFTGGVTIDGVALGNPDLTIQHGTAGLTQFADNNGTVEVNVLQQDGFSAGSLESVSVSAKGRVVGTYSNSRTVDLAEVTLATFNGPNYLKRLDGGAFAATSESGAASYGAAGQVVGSSLEGSNSDIGDEFTKLIVTQQAYSANTRVISTSNQMVQDLLNTLR